MYAVFCCIQAVMASDFAMGRFHFMEKLLLVHGHWSYSRLARIMLYFFYKNMVHVYLLYIRTTYCTVSTLLIYSYATSAPIVRT